MTTLKNVNIVNIVYVPRHIPDVSANTDRATTMACCCCCPAAPSALAPLTATCCCCCCCCCCCPCYRCCHCPTTANVSIDVNTPFIFRKSFTLPVNVDHWVVFPSCCSTDQQSNNGEVTQSGTANRPIILWQRAQSGVRTFYLFAAMLFS